jgi:hypothetical protein
MTTAEYFQTPETVVPQELAFGELRVADSPSVSHQRVVRELVMALTPFVQDRHLGELLFAPMDVVLDFEADLVVQPDLLFVAKERSEIVTDKVRSAGSGHRGPVDLPADWQTLRAARGFAGHVRECWLARMPEKQISV